MPEDKFAVIQSCDPVQLFSSGEPDRDIVRVWYPDAITRAWL